MNDKAILFSNVRSWHEQLPQHGHEDAGLGFWLELNERIYDGIVFPMTVMPEPKCYVHYKEAKVEVEALPHRLKAFFSGFDAPLGGREPLRLIAAEAAFELNQEILREDIKLFAPYLLAFKTVSFLPPGDFTCCGNGRLRSRYAVIK